MYELIGQLEQIKKNYTRGFITEDELEHESMRIIELYAIKKALSK